jgi:excinuclease ABC subunit A
LQDVGLGYVQLDNPLLRGGENKKNKTSLFLGKRSDKRKALFVFDEPTGLHFHDIKKLLASFNALIDKGHSILVIEHNLDLIKCADWIIDLGPEGGENGGSC